MPKAKRRAPRATSKYQLNVQAAEELYREVYPRLQHFASEILHQVNYLVEAERVDLAFPVQHRVKTFESAAAKLQRKAMVPANLTDLQDLVGIRLVLLFRRDVARVCEVVASTFGVVERYDAGEKLGTDQFGYSSIHFVIRAPEAWMSVPSLAACRNLKAEIQIRTTAQHIWAAASHVMQYKSEQSVPEPIRRAIHRVSALLETVDLEFERVLEERDRYKAEISAGAPAGEQLNVDILEQVLDGLWPVANKHIGNEGYARLLSELAAVGITTKQALLDAVTPHRKFALERDKQAAADILERSGEGANERAKAGVYFVHTGLTRVALDAALGEKWQAALGTIAVTRRSGKR